MIRLPVELVGQVDPEFELCVLVECLVPLLVGLLELLVGPVN